MSNMPERIWAWIAPGIYDTTTTVGHPRWDINDERAKGSTEYIRADVANAEIERLKAENTELSGEVKWLKECESVEVERLKKALDQAVRIGWLEQRGSMVDCGFNEGEWEEAPELAAYLKEKDEKG